MPCSFSVSPILYGVCHASTLDNAGLNTHRSGLCIKLWLALAFLVEQADYRHTVDGYVIPLAQKLRDTRDDDIEEAPRKPQNRSQVRRSGKYLCRFGPAMSPPLESA